MYYQQSPNRGKHSDDPINMGLLAVHLHRCRIDASNGFYKNTYYAGKINANLQKFFNK